MYFSLGYNFAPSSVPTIFISAAAFSPVSFWLILLKPSPKAQQEKCQGSVW
jgi:hypothetical protein